MKIGDYILVCFLASLVLTLCVMPELACSPQEEGPAVNNPDPNVPPRPENHPKDPAGAQKPRIETYELQYAQLLENHRSYFYDLLIAFSVYLAVMGACLTVVCHGLIEMKQKGPNASSRTILLILIFFAFTISVVVIVCLYFGAEDAARRMEEVREVAKHIYVAPIDIELLEDLFYLIIIGPMVIIFAWYAALLRLFMACGSRYKWGDSCWLEWLSGFIGLMWLVAHLLFWLGNKYGITWCSSLWFIRAFVVVGVLWFSACFIYGILVARRQYRAELSQAVPPGPLNEVHS